MSRKPKPKSDDPAESKRFIDMARELGADESDKGRRAFERAFERVAPALSRAMIDNALTAWRQGAEVFAAATRALATSEAAGWMLFARFTTTVDVAWIGLAEACVIADGAIALRTRPHSLRATHAAAPDVATRSMTRDAIAVADTVSWLAPAGSRILCSSSPLDDASVVARAAGELAAAARALVDAASGGPAVAVVVERG